MNAGDYTATAMLEGGYVWADGSTDPKTIEWTIAKTPLVASYAGETVEEGETPQLAVQVSGFVNNETAATAAGFVGPSIVAPAQMKAGESYELAPAGGAADNYVPVVVVFGFNFKKYLFDIYSGIQYRANGKS